MVVAAERIGSQNTVEDIAEAEGDVEVDGVVFTTVVCCGCQADTSTGDEEAIDSVARGLKTRIRPAEALFIPKVDAGFVLQVEVYVEIGEGRASMGDSSILSVVAQVRCVKVKDIVVFDAISGGTARRVIPDALKQTSGHQPAVGQTKRWQPAKKFGVMRIADA